MKFYANNKIPVNLNTECDNTIHELETFVGRKIYSTKLKWKKNIINT
jgi:hypothetical protein